MSASDPAWIGLFDLFRIGVGPSSSHTVGPMLAAARFIAEIPIDLAVERLRVELFSSLALTGKGHATDTAVILGLLGHRPDTLDLDRAASFVASVAEHKLITLPSGRDVIFDPAHYLDFGQLAGIAGDVYQAVDICAGRFCNI